LNKDSLTQAAILLIIGVVFAFHGALFILFMCSAISFFIIVEQGGKPDDDHGNKSEFIKFITSHSDEYICPNCLTFYDLAENKGDSLKLSRKYFLKRSNDYIEFSDEDERWCLTCKSCCLTKAPKVKYSKEDWFYDYRNNLLGKFLAGGVLFTIISSKILTTIYFILPIVGFAIIYFIIKLRSFYIESGVERYADKEIKDVFIDYYKHSKTGYFDLIKSSFSKGALFEASFLFRIDDLYFFDTARMFPFVALISEFDFEPKKGERYTLYLESFSEEARYFYLTNKEI